MGNFGNYKIEKLEKIREIREIKEIEMKKFILIVFFAACFFASCQSDNNFDSADPEAISANILKNYRENGMNSWWEILAVYDADENPMDYAGFDEVLASLEGDSNAKMASYVLVTNISVIIGADEGYFEYYGEYKEKLKAVLENPADNYTLNDYIFACFALMSSDTHFDPLPFYNHLADMQKPDGGFSLSGDTGDVDVTAFAVSALWLIYSYNETTVRFGSAAIDAAVKFLEDSVGENGALSSFGNANANSTAAALSSLSRQSENGELLQKIADGLMLFKVKGEAGYSFLEGGASNALATAQAAIALRDYKNRTSVWEKLYLESLYAYKE